MSRSRLKSLQVKYYPPELNVRIEESGKIREKLIRLPPLSKATDISELAQQVIANNPEFQQKHAEKLEAALDEILKMQLIDYSNFYLQHVHKTHEMPLTDCAFNKMGELYITSSYDRTCSIWETESGRKVGTCVGHKNCVYSCCFNVPYGNLIGTGSMDHNAAIWSTEGKLIHMLKGHSKEVINVKFDLSGKYFGSAGMDCLAKVWDVQTGSCLNTFDKHTQEIVSVDFHPNESILLTASFDKTACLWDFHDNKCISTLSGHNGDVIGAYFSNDGTMIVTGSLDRTARIWDARNPSDPLFILRGHSGEVINVSFSVCSTKVATSSSDQTAKVWDSKTGKLISTCEGHREEVGKVVFNPQGSKILTASDDCTCRLWDIQDGNCLEVLEGHTDIVINCAFNYSGDRIITASKDNTVRQWKAGEMTEPEEDDFEW